MELTVVRVPAWPALAWLAVGRGARVTAYVGPRVETGDGWFCEAAWDGPFGEGGFDRTDVVFGSGGRVRGDRIVFVSSGSTLDRLHSRRIGDELQVSNSLACLLAFAGGSLRLDDTGYRAFFDTVRAGLRAYDPDLPTTVGPVRLTYFDNLVWDGRDLEQTDKPLAERDFSTYERYRTFLGDATRGLAANARAPERRPPFGLTVTLSSGYDSSTAAVLAHEAGCTEAFGFGRSKGGLDDSGAPLAAALGLELHTLSIEGAPKADVLFLAAGTGDGGDAQFRAGEDLLRDRVVFTGHWGDRVWGLKETAFEPAFPRQDTSGTDLMEYRLTAGFLHAALPFLGARQLKEIRAIATSPELAPWDLGREYNRPISRRIVEEAGVPREAFGMRKRAVFRGPPGPPDFLTPELRADYERWLRSRWWGFVRARTIPPSRQWDWLTVRAGADPARRRRLHRYVIHWAVDRAKERYPAP